MNIIRNVTNCIKGGYMSVITGDDMDKVEAVILENLTNGEECRVEPVNKCFSTVTFKVPEGKYTPYAVSVVSNGEKSDKLLMNVPKIRWVLEDGIAPGGEMRIIGEGFADIDVYKERVKNDTGKGHGYGIYTDKYDTEVILKGEKEYKLDIKKLSNYEITGIIPNELIPGEYDIIIKNAVCSEAFKVTIEEKKEYPKEVFNVLDYGAKAIPLRDVYYTQFFDSSDGFQKALDAAHANGGGTVFVPNGRYCFKKSIRIYPYTKLLGEDKDRVWFELPKGMSGEDGWGTYQEGFEIYTLIAGDAGDFTIENINMFGVYSPMLIAAPMRKGEPVYGDDIYNRRPLYSNLLDDSMDADNVVIRNCSILQEPTFLEDRKVKSDPFFRGGYNNVTKKFEGMSGENPYAITDGWTAIAIKGNRITIENNKIQGGGSCIRLMATQNATLRGNILLSGEKGNCFGFFSTSYNPNEHWSKQVQNIIIEENHLKPLTNVTRGCMWIMQEHGNYYMRGNTIDSFFYMADSEGFCFHLWGEYLRFKVNGGSKEISVDMASRVTEEAYRGKLDEDKNFIPDSLKGWCFYVVDGRGIGQFRTIIANGKDTLTLDEALDCELDETSIVSISNIKKFENNIIVDNEAKDLGRGIYYWGSSNNGIIDGNTLSRNSGVLIEDLSFHYSDVGGWQHAGHLYNQILNNKLTAPRGFCANYGVIGVSGGSVKGSSTSVIIRGNVCEDDAVLVAKPVKNAPDGLNYSGIVIEDNMSKDCEIGIEVSETVNVTIHGNEFENVQNEIVGAGEQTVVVK